MGETYESLTSNKVYIGFVERMHTVATFDQPMINQWTMQQEAIQERLSSMQCNLPPPYRHAPIPKVQRPEYILSPEY